MNLTCLQTSMKMNLWRWRFRWQRYFHW